ncbi:MAG: IS630 family transposase [Chloroflexi bacterium]|nr:IS630 family transposase [Chloroflexota bacterium]
METPADLVPRSGEARSRVRGKKGSIITAYLNPQPNTRVICIDEMGPIAVKTYPGEEWKPGPNRATFEPDYGRRGKVWVHGAFEPATGQASIVISPRRDSASHIQLLEKMIRAFPTGRWLIIEDNLSIHTSRQVKLALAAWPEIQVQFIPKYACWLNLIEPWWKQLRSLARKGRCFENLDQLTLALNQALDYWNAHRHPYLWKKKPQTQFSILGGFSVSTSPLSLAV